MTNEELLAALRVEIGWLKNELIRIRDAMDQMNSAAQKLKRIT